MNDAPVPTLDTTRSRDGTRFALERGGEGPPLVPVGVPPAPRGATAGGA